jgi:hypothetical protein
VPLGVALEWFGDDLGMVLGTVAALHFARRHASLNVDGTFVPGLNGGVRCVHSGLRSALHFIVYLLSFTVYCLPFTFYLSPFTFYILPPTCAGNSSHSMLP